MASPNDWRIEGDYFEACNCDVVCPCLFLGNPDQGECNVTAAWHISKGHFNETSLDDLGVVGAFHSPGNMFTGPKWKAALYLDGRATKEQADALGAIFSGQAGGFFGVLAGLVGEIAGVRSVPIEFKADGKKRSIKIDSAIDVIIQAVEGQDKQETVLSNPPMTITPGFPATVATSTKNSYNDHGMRWDNSGKNGLYAKFSYSP